MKQLNIVLCTFFLINIIISNAVCQGQQQKISITEDLFYQKITDSVFLIIHYFPPPFGCNSLLVVYPEKKAVLIDTPNESTGTKSLIEWIDERFGQPELMVINTGFHQDNLGGNAYLTSCNIPIYGSDATARLISEKGNDLKALLLETTSKLENRRYYDSFNSMNFIPPGNTFPLQKGIILIHGKELIEVYFPGESHTVDNVVVYLHKRKLLFGGCMVYSEQSSGKGYLKDANLEEWPQSLLNVKARFSDARIVVPGHGYWGDLSLIDHTIDILQK